MEADLHRYRETRIAIRLIACTTSGLRYGQALGRLESNRLIHNAKISIRKGAGFSGGRVTVVDERVVVIGAGPAGLAAAAALEQEGVTPLILERGPGVATSWRSRHDHLRLNTHRMLSHQPERRLPRRLGPYPDRDGYIAYLEGCATGMRLQTNTIVERIDRHVDGWTLVGGASGHGDLTTRHVVVATGPDLCPVMPSWRGQETFSGELLHAGQFRNVADVRGRSVLVVGPGNSGVDLLNYLVADAAVGELWLSARSGMNIVPMRVLGIPAHPVAVLGRYLPSTVQDLNIRVLQRVFLGDLPRYGYPRAELGALARVNKDNVTAAVDNGFVAALKRGRVTMRPGVDHIDGLDVHFTDGTTCRPDVVICATGYRPGLESLVGHLVDLDHIGMPPFTGAGADPRLPGLWFFGLNRSIYGNMHIRRRESRQLAQAISH